MIGKGGITTDPEKVIAITNWPVPKNLKQVRGFLGLAGWYRRFLQNFSTETFPITEVISTKKKFKWTDEAHAAFERVKSLLTTAPVLANPDFSKSYTYTVMRVTLASEQFWFNLTMKATRDQWLL